MKIAFFSTQPYDRQYFTRFNKEHELVYFEARLGRETAALAKGCRAVCVFVNDVLDKEVLQILQQLGVEIIALRCAGYNNVDLKAASELDFAVVRVPAYSPHAVAEHAVALILSLNRKIHKAYNRVREGNFSLDRLTGFDLYGKTVGVIGTGKIGAVFAGIMGGFGCRVLAFDIIANRDLEANGVKYLPIMDILEQSDILSLHCPLNDQTRHLINDQTLSMIKPGSMLINTSRGALVDTEAAINALKSGRLGYLGIDVYEQEEKLFFYDRSEELIEDDLILRLISFPNVLITAHQGFFTEEALTQIAVTTLENIDLYAAGLPVKNSILG
ncbi:2-hydroxyacid dehydrogenase [Flavihumibacter profundi]|uniref:2-hydroxyacid dehydrogenase n=1 Tax=Flavihumibacter profundi TaxID=2716883 RepID=UPI001CC51A45|nr:2-hydroxyacid dehydrogenase [Flavihumibacter profundi]MBZ5857464.1 2-hydroxyacid dehydrogenase [Flavihumibacter profundi]